MFRRGSKHLYRYYREKDCKELPQPKARQTAGKLSPGQNAQLSELLQYLHLRIRGLIESAEISQQTDRASIPQRRWQDLLDLESRLARYLRSIGEPG